MILQTGGRALGATSTRSSPSSRARRRASAVEVEPILLSSWSIRKTGEILICSLWRKLVEMAVHSCVKTVAAARHSPRNHRQTPDSKDPSTRPRFAPSQRKSAKTRNRRLAAPPIGFQGKDPCDGGRGFVGPRCNDLLCTSPGERSYMATQTPNRVRAIARIIGRPSTIIMRVRVSNCKDLVAKNGFWGWWPPLKRRLTGWRRVGGR